MCAYVICKNCGEKIRVRRPTGRTQLDNVRTEGVNVEGGKISFQQGGKISFGQGGKVGFGPPPNRIRVLCPFCGKEFEYSINEIMDD